jgi:hypothetical protein
MIMIEEAKQNAFLMRYSTRRTITDGMIFRYGLYELSEQLIREKQADIRFGSIVNEAGEFLAHCSYINIKGIGLFLLSALDKEYYYEGAYPGDLFFGNARIKLKKNFQGIMPDLLAEGLRQVLNEKAGRVFEFSQDVEQEVSEWLELDW